MVTASPGGSEVGQDEVAGGEEIVAVVILLLVFSVCGVLGNVLVLFVFSRRHDGLVSTYFILLLAAIDFTTSLVVMPTTAYMEYQQMHIGDHDLLCKLYQFSLTSVIPLSALIMAAIAIDRYLCICHPLVKLLTVPRAKAITVLLVALASGLGVMTSLIFGVYQYAPIPSNSSVVAMTTTSEDYSDFVSTATTYRHGNHVIAWQQLLADIAHESLFHSDGLGQETDSNKDARQFNGNVTAASRDYEATTPLANSGAATRSDDDVVVRPAVSPSVVYLGDCLPNFMLISQDTAFAYQKVYYTLYLVCLITVIVLYVLIYRSVAARHRSMRSRSTLAALRPPSPASALLLTDTCQLPCERPGLGGVESVLMLPLQRHRSLCMDNRHTMDADADYHHYQQSLSPHQQPYLQLPSSSSPTSSRSSSVVTSLIRSTIGRTRQLSSRGHNTDFLPNIRLAAMLFVVAVVFMVAFFPAFLMSLNLIPNNMIVFYMYFAYNIANPLIYSFMNKNFREELAKRLLRRQRKRAAAAASRVSRIL